MLHTFWPLGTVSAWVQIQTQITRHPGPTHEAGASIRNAPHARFGQIFYLEILPNWAFLELNVQKRH